MTCDQAIGPLFELYCDVFGHPIPAAWHVVYEDGSAHGFDGTVSYWIGPEFRTALLNHPTVNRLADDAELENEEEGFIPRCTIDFMQYVKKGMK